jgi:hypothetical protein
VPCSLGALPADQSRGRTYDFEFQLDFAQYNCDNLYQRFQQLWNVPTHLILLLSTRQGSVIARFFISDSSDGSTVASRFAALTADLATPGSPSNTFANANGIPVIRAAVVAPDSSLIFIIVGVVGGVVLIALVVVLIVCLRRHHGNNRDAKYTVSECFCFFFKKF